MAVPRVFVSSTWYDLRYIRENLRYFIRTIGYEPVLAEDGSIYYNPKLHVQDACIAEIPNCQMFVLIIGGKHGSAFKGTAKSVTNYEASEAARLKIPIFALVETSVLNDFYLYEANKDNPDIDAKKLKYPSSDSTTIFDFIREIRSNTLNNALVPFIDFADIENYLRQQWAAMMLNFLVEKNEADRVSDTLAMLKNISERVEVMSQQILDSVGTKAAKLNMAMYDLILQNECFRDIAFMGGHVNPQIVLENNSFDDCCRASGVTLKVEEDEEDMASSVGGDGTISAVRHRHNLHSFVRAKQRIEQLLSDSGLEKEQFLQGLPN